MKFTHIILIIVLVIVGGFFVRQKFFNEEFKLPKGDKTTTKTILIQDGVVIDEIQNEVDITKEPENTIMSKEIMITDGVKHSVPLEDILGGGPAKDGIPPIDNPKFESAKGASFLSDDEPGISFADRFYPFQILVWHEIVNDTINGQRALITYCPLCLSGIVFDPVVQGERVEFGTSGKLWNSNLVMYDRKTDSLWSQILGESILGEMTGNQLKVLPSDQMRFGEWKKQFPNGKVLTRDTGAVRFYGADPYGDYYTDNSRILFPLDKTDNRLEAKDFILGIVINGRAKAYLPKAIKAIGEVKDIFEGQEINLKYDADLDVVRIFNDKGDRINPFPSFWFSWVAAHPETKLYK